jgi:deoxyribodipyrimidine photolyase
VFLRLAHQHRQFVQDLVMNLQALAIVLERRGYPASCYTCGDQMNSASFMVSLGDNHLIRFLVSDYGITWTEMRDDRELMKLEGAEAINQLQELANIVKQPTPVCTANKALAKKF